MTFAALRILHGERNPVALSFRSDDPAARLARAQFQHQNNLCTMFTSLSPFVVAQLLPTETDGDGVPDDTDNCPGAPNPIRPTLIED